MWSLKPGCGKNKEDILKKQKGDFYPGHPGAIVKVGTEADKRGDAGSTYREPGKISFTEYLTLLKIPCSPPPFFGGQGIFDRKGF